MHKQNLSQAHEELFRRSPDECFGSLDALIQHCQRRKDQSTDRWQLPQEIVTSPNDGPLMLDIGNDGAFLMNDWSFTQLCKLARVSKDTVNRLSPNTADLIFRETLPAGRKPLQLLTAADRVRSIHGVAYLAVIWALLFDAHNQRDGTRRGRGVRFGFRRPGDRGSVDFSVDVNGTQTGTQTGASVLDWPSISRWYPKRYPNVS